MFRQFNHSSPAWGRHRARRDKKDQAPGEEPPSKGKRKGVPKGKAKAKAKGTRKSCKAAQQDEQVAGLDDGDQWQQCSDCDVWKFVQEFGKDQKACKGCVNCRRHLKTYVTDQKCEAEVEELKKTDRAGYKKFMAKFRKLKEQAQRTNEKVNFSVREFFETFKASRGSRKQGLGEMMWEGEYYEFAKTPKAGFLTRTEAENNWKTWVNDDKLLKDMGGPRGFPRCWVKTSDQVASYEDFAHERGIHSGQKLNKAITAEQMQAKMQSALNFAAADDCVDDEHGFDFQSMQAKIALQMGASSQDTSAFSGVVSMPSFAASTAKKAGKKEKGEEEEEDDDADPANDAAAPPPGQKKKGDGKGKDGKDTQLASGMEVKINKYDRKYVSDNEKSKVALTETLNKMKALQLKHQATPMANKVQSELEVMQKRQRWLAVVLEGTDEELSKLIKEVDEPQGDRPGQSEADAQSKSLGSLVRAGPCNDYSTLKIFGEFEMFRPGIRRCANEEELKAAVAKASPLRKVLQGLMASCKEAMNDVDQGVGQVQTAEKEAAARKAETEKKRKQDGAGAGDPKKNRTEGTGTLPGILSIDTEPYKELMASQVADKVSSNWTGRTPFVLTGNNKVMAEFCKEARFAKFMDDWKLTFDNSSNNITEGRAQRRMDTPDVADSSLAIATHFASALGDTPLSFTAPEHLKVLKASLGVSVFSLAAGTMSNPKPEIRGLACCRWIVEGTRTVVLVDMQDGARVRDGCNASEFLSWLASATPASIEEYRKKGGKVWFTTVSTGDILYTPAGFAVGHQVLANSDCVGFRIGCYSADQIEMMKHLKDSVLKLSGRNCPEHSETITAMELQQTSSRPSAVPALQALEAGKAAVATSMVQTAEHERQLAFEQERLAALRSFEQARGQADHHAKDDAVNSIAVKPDASSSDSDGEGSDGEGSDGEGSKSEGSGGEGDPQSEAKKELCGLVR